MRIIQCKQLSHEWFQARCGRVTASEVTAVMSFLKSGKGETEKRRDYKTSIISEILTGKVDMEGFCSTSMLWGQEHEGEARNAYELQTGMLVRSVGFVVHPILDRAGSSPDGLVDNDGGIEIKCPKTKTHLAAILSDEIPEEYLPQMHFNMACCERQWWDFISFDPRLPEPLQMFTKRLIRDNEKIDELEKGVSAFLLEVDQIIAGLKARVGDFPHGKLYDQEQSEIESSREGFLTDEDFEGLIK